MIAVFRNGSAMAGVKNHDAMNMEKLHFKSNSNESRVVFRLVDAALAAEGLEDARRKVTLPHLEHRNG